MMKPSVTYGINRPGVERVDGLWVVVTKLLQKHTFTLAHVGSSG